MRMDVLITNIPPCCHISLPYIMGYNQVTTFKKSTKEFKPHGYTHHIVLHCNYCHFCNVDFVLFHIVTYDANCLVSHIHINTTNLLNIMCTLIAMCMILGRLECVTCMDDKYCFPFECIWTFWHTKYTLKEQCFHVTNMGWGAYGIFSSSSKSILGYVYLQC